MWYTIFLGYMDHLNLIFIRSGDKKFKIQKSNACFWNEWDNLYLSKIECVKCAIRCFTIICKIFNKSQKLESFFNHIKPKFHFFKCSGICRVFEKFNLKLVLQHVMHNHCCWKFCWSSIIKKNNKKLKWVGFNQLVIDKSL